MAADLLPLTHGRWAIPADLGHPLFGPRPIAADLRSLTRGRKEDDPLPLTYDPLPLTYSP